MSAFDYGADVQAPQSEFKLWPTEGEMTALIDADMPPYIVAYTTDPVRVQRSLRSAELLYEGEEDKKNSVPWMECLLKTPYFRDKVDHLNSIINDWVGLAEADSAKLYMTGDDNYRDLIAFTSPYKGERNPDKPPFFYELRTYLKEYHNAIVAEGIEADDAMSIEQARANTAVGVPIGTKAHMDFATTCIVSKDKDLRLNSGWHVDINKRDRLYVSGIGSLSPRYKDKERVKYTYFPLFGGEAIHPDSSDLYCQGSLFFLIDGTKQDSFLRGAKAGQGKFKRVKDGYEAVPVMDKLEGTGLKFFYAQIIMGDSVDNYQGLAGVGMVSAYERLDSCPTEEELHETVLKMYKDKYSGGTNEPVWWDNYKGGRALLTPEQLMVEQGRLAWMKQSQEDLWMPEVFVPNIEDEVWEYG